MSTLNSVRPFHLVIFGASGSAGRFLVEELALVAEKFYQPKKREEGLAEDQANAATRKQSVPRHALENGLKWALAGRSAMKLSNVLCRAELSTGVQDLSKLIPILLADLNQHNSLLEMCSKTQLVINCAGPYSFESEALVVACLKSRTNYIDLCHESKFIDKIRLKYFDQAEKAGIYIINGCGFQSMSAEMGLNYIKQIITSNDGDQVEEVKIMLNLSDTRAVSRGSGEKAISSGIISPGMWTSFLSDKSRQMIDGDFQSKTNFNYGNNDQQFDLQKSENFSSSCGVQQFSTNETRKQLLRKDTQILVRNNVEYVNKNSLTWFGLLYNLFKENSLPINSLISDESQLIRGEMTNYQVRKPDLIVDKGCWRPIRCSSFINMNSFTHSVLLICWIFLFNLLIRFSIFRKLMNNFPTLTSYGFVYSRSKIGDNLSRDSLSHIKFSQTFLAYGIPGTNSADPLGDDERPKNNPFARRKQKRLLVARIVGPEPNHIATAIFAIQASLAVILEKEHLPMEGGVLTPGAAFAETNIIHLLRRRNIKFELLKKA